MAFRKQRGTSAATSSSSLVSGGNSASAPTTGNNAGATTNTISSSSSTNANSSMKSSSRADKGGARITRIPFHRRQPQDCLTTTLASLADPTNTNLASYSMSANSQRFVRLTANAKQTNKQTISPIIIIIIYTRYPHITNFSVFKNLFHLHYI